MLMAILMKKNNSGEKLKSLLLLVVCALFFSCSDDQTTEQISDQIDYYYDVEPTDSSNFEIAKFAMRVPEGIEDFRAILVIVPGRNADGRPYKDWTVFNYFAGVERVAIVSCYFYGDEEDELYFRTWYGSDQVLIDAISNLSDLAGRPELKNLPLLFWGHSAGGMYGFSFTARHPERVAACAPVRSAEFSTDPDLNFRYVPIMFSLGENDDPTWNASCVSIWGINRKLGAQWAYAIEPFSGHDIGNCTTLTMPFFSNVLRLRVGDSINHYSEMTRINETDGWLGDPEELTISRYDLYEGEVSEACWFPDSSTAVEWFEYVQ